MELKPSGEISIIKILIESKLEMIQSLKSEDTPNSQEVLISLLSDIEKVITVRYQRVGTITKKNTATSRPI